MYNSAIYVDKYYNSQLLVKKCLCLAITDYAVFDGLSYKSNRVDMWRYVGLCL